MIRLESFMFIKFLIVRNNARLTFPNFYFSLAKHDCKNAHSKRVYGNLNFLSELTFWCQSGLSALPIGITGGTTQKSVISPRDKNG